jgi:hypothetical protein
MAFRPWMYQKKTYPNPNPVRTNNDNKINTVAAEDIESRIIWLRITSSTTVLVE